MTCSSYTYNGDGLRMTKTVNGTQTNHFLDGQNVVADQTGSKTTKYHRGLGLIRINNGTQKGYYVQNAHGDVTKIVSSAGTTLADYSFDAYGNQKQNSNNFENPFRYCGEYFDSETGSIYLRARYYDSATGRFTSEDPIKDGLNWYVYAGNNPVLLVDPSGCAAVLHGKNNRDTFIEQLKIISGNENIDAELNIETVDNDYIISSLDNELLTDDGSVTGFSLMKYIIDSDTPIKIVFNSDKDRSDSNFWLNTITMNGWSNDSESLASFIHEAAHAYTFLNGYDANVRGTVQFTDENNPDNIQIENEIVRLYAEAAAITVENRFRAEMGYASRDTSQYGGIGINDYGCWPHIATQTPGTIVRYTDIAIYGNATAHLDTYSHGPFLAYDIVKKAGATLR